MASVCLTVALMTLRAYINSERISDRDRVTFEKLLVGPETMLANFQGVTGLRSLISLNGMSVLEVLCDEPERKRMPYLPH